MGRFWTGFELLLEETKALDNALIDWVGIRPLELQTPRSKSSVFTAGIASCTAMYS